MLARPLCAVAISLLALSGYADQERNYPFSIENEKEGDGHRIVARNNGPAPVSVKVSIIDSQYIAPDRPFPVYAVVPPGGGTLYLARIRPAMSGVGYTFRTQFTWLLGDFNAEQAPDALYRLPFPDGAAYHIGQAPGGPITTHASPDSQYAVDIGMPQGAPVVAARDGVVIATEAGQTEGGQTPEMLTKANAVRIQHADGTIAVYAHLAHGGVYVYPGQRVSAGQQIGLAGSTGYSSGPHLHFAVQTLKRSSDGFELISLPFRFYLGNPPAAFSPEFGMLAKADYNSPGAIPGLDAPTRVVKTQSPSTSSGPAASGGSEEAVSLQVPAEVRSYLLRIPTWKWFAGMVAVVVLLGMLDKVRSARRQRGLRVVREPTFRSRPADEPIFHGLSARDRLIIACGGDRQKAESLMEYERQRAPGIDDQEAALRAWQQMQSAAIRARSAVRLDPRHLASHPEDD